MTTTNRADESLGGDETRKTIDFVMGADLRSKPGQLKLFNKLVKFLLREKKKTNRSVEGQGVLGEARGLCSKNQAVGFFDFDSTTESLQTVRSTSFHLLSPAGAGYRVYFPRNQGGSILGIPSLSEKERLGEGSGVWLITAPKGGLSTQPKP